MIQLLKKVLVCKCFDIDLTMRGRIIFDQKLSTGLRSCQMKSDLVRGYYGPLPSAFFSKNQLLARGIGAFVAGAIGGHFSSLCRLMPLGASQTSVLEGCAKKLRFEMWRPDNVPAGYRIVSATPSTTIGDAVIIELRGQTQWQAFEIAQRERWLPIDEQLSTAGVPFTRVPGTERRIFIVHGRYGGEPIDRAFWTTRQAVMFEHGELIVEFREVRGLGPGVRALVHYACASLRAGTGR
jgi:hypothetical protein